MNIVKRYAQTNSIVRYSKKLDKNKPLHALRKVFTVYKSSLPSNKIKNKDGDDFILLFNIVYKSVPRIPNNFKVIRNVGKSGDCTECNSLVATTSDEEIGYCNHCGQSLDWDSTKKIHKRKYNKKDIKKGKNKK